MKRIPTLLWVSVAVFCFAALLNAALPQFTSSKWTPAENLATAREGASAVLLPDGRILITGGTDAAGQPLASAELFNIDGSFTAAAPMNAARSGHVAVMLYDGDVLVAGGTTTGGGVTNSAELYDLNADRWTTLSGTMLDARTGATAAQLFDGDVLIAGGQDTHGVPLASLERFVLSQGVFTHAGALVAARKDAAAAVLNDGRVLITGGTNADANGNSTLASTEIYDPAASSISAGPALVTARAGHSATTLLDGTVLIAGGNNPEAAQNGAAAELASAEIYDPAAGAVTATASLATARTGHQAFLLPNNNNVLIVGGSAAGTALASAELYAPWNRTFQTTAAMATARAGATGAALYNPSIKTGTDGLLLVAGGKNDTGTLASSELYGFATVKTDAADYPPGSTVTITGSGWQPGETVTLTLEESPLIDTHGPYTTIADAFGNISDSSFVTDAYDENIRFYLTASGSQSQAQNTFTDSKPNTASLTPSSFTVLPGNTATYTVTVNFNGNGNSCSSPLSLAFTAPAPVGTTQGFSPNPLISTGGDASSTLSITTRNTGPASGRTQPGTYPFTVTAGNGTGCQSGTATANGTLVVAGSAIALSVTGYPSPTTAGTPQNFTVTALDANGNTAIGYTNTVHFTSSDSQAALPANYTFVAADKGTHTFSATLKTAGTQSITATDTVTGTITGTQGGIAVSAAATAKLLVANYPSPVTAGTSNSFTVTATDASGNLTAGYTGTVHFTSSDGAATLPANYTFTTGNGKDNGTHTFSATLNTAGAQSITATDTGTASINGTQPGITVNASTVATSLALAAPSPASVAFGSAGPVTFSATLTRTTGGAAVSGTTVNFTVDGNAAGSATTSASGVATVSNYNPSAISVAGHDVQASFAGAAISGTTYSASTSGIQTLTVSTADQTINFGMLADKTYGDASFTVSATGGASGNAVTFTASPASVCTATGTNGSTITITGAGACAVTAHQAGNSNYNAATDVQQSLTVNKKDATWTTNPSNKTYGEVDPTPLTTGSGSGFLVADSVSATYSRVAGETVAGSPYHVTATLSATVAGALNNYNITNAGASFTINRRDATWTTNAGSKTYGDADPTPLTTGSGNNFVAADNVTASYSRAAGETVLGGPYHITAALSPAGVLSNYNITNAGANFTINRRDATWTTNEGSKTYGDADATPLTTGSGNNFVAADNVTASYSRAAGETVLGGPYHITAALSPAAVLSNYNITNTGANFTINRRDATWTINAGSKTYGDADPTPLTTGSGSNFVAADNVTATYTRATGETVLGGPYHITAALSPPGVLSNYNVTNTGASFTINRRDATWTINAGSKTYGDADPTPLTTGSGSNFVAADNVTATYTRATGETVLGGPYHITAALSPSGVLSNYNITNTGASFTINRRDATWTTNEGSKTYGDADPTPLTTGSGNNFVAADNVTASYSRAAGETVLGGPYHITAALSPAAVLSNYNITNTGASFTINRRDATWSINAGSKTYGDADPTPLTTGSGNNFVAADNVTASYSRAAGETVLGGPYHIAAALSPAGMLDNYNITNTGANFTINRRDATWSTNAASKTYGDADPSPLTTGSGSNFVAADNLTASYSRAAGETVLGGPYHIAAALSPAGVLSNYNITNAGANFTINRRDATWSTNVASKTYGDADATPLTTGSGSNFVVADNVTATYTRATGETVLGGPYHISAALSPAGVLDNYNITNAGASFTINKRDASVTPNAASKTYGDSDPALTGTLTNFVASDGVIAAYSRTVGETVAASPYTISAALSPMAVLGNYNLTYNTAAFTINKRDASVTPNAASKTYGDSDPTLTGALTNFVAFDGVAASYSRTAGETVAGSPYSISAALSPAAVLDNYNLTYNTGSFTIGKRNASVTPNAASKTYGDSDPGLTGTLTNFVTSDGVTAGYSRTAGETVAGSPYSISAALSPAAVLDNYNLTYNTGSFTIGKRNASVTPNAASKTYGDSDPELTGALTNFVTSDGVTASYSRTAGETVAASPYTISAALSPAAVLGNYNITYNNANFTIGKRDASVTPNAASKTYGDSDPGLTGALTNFVASDGVTASYSRTAGETVAASPYTISAALSPAAVLGNYNLTYNTAAFTINKRNASVTPNAASKTYGNSDPALTGTLTNFVASDGVTASYSRTAGETVAGSPYSISAALSPTAVLGNYNLTYNTAAFTIGKAILTVKADNKTMVLHDALPTFTATYTGFKFSDTFASAVTGSPSLTTTASSASAVGPYTVVAAGGTLAANNYTFAFVNGTLNIYYSTGACLGDLGHAVLQPINASGTVSVFKLGSTVPTKFRVCDVNGVSIGTPGVVTGYGLVAAVNSPNITVDEDAYSTTPDTAFRWAGDQWIFNQSTKNNGTLNKTGTTYYFGINLNDGSWIYFQYGLK